MPVRDDIEIIEQHSKQDHAARHSKHAGEERGEYNRRAREWRAQRKGHGLWRRIRAERAERAIDHVDRVLDAIHCNEGTRKRGPFLLAEQHLIEHVEPVEGDAGPLPSLVLILPGSWSRNGSRRPTSINELS